MLDNKSNAELVEHVTSNVAATREELLLAERLTAAIEELDRMAAMLAKAEADRGPNT